MAPTCLYALPTMFGHAPDESADGVLGDLLPDRIRASVTSWTVCGGAWNCQMHRYITSYKCSIEFRSGRREGQSMTSMSSSSRNCLHIPATWGRAMSCIRSNPGSTAAAQVLTIAEDFIPVHNISCAVQSTQLKTVGFPKKKKKKRSSWSRLWNWP